MTPDARDRCWVTAQFIVLLAASWLAVWGLFWLLLRLLGVVVVTTKPERRLYALPPEEVHPGDIVGFWPVTSTAINYRAVEADPVVAPKMVVLDVSHGQQLLCLPGQLMWVLR